MSNIHAVRVLHDVCDVQDVHRICDIHNFHDVCDIRNVPNVRHGLDVPDVHYVRDVCDVYNVDENCGHCKHRGAVLRGRFEQLSGAGRYAPPPHVVRTWQKPVYNKVHDNN